MLNISLTFYIYFLPVLSLFILHFFFLHTFSSTVTGKVRKKIRAGIPIGNSGANFKCSRQRRRATKRGDRYMNMS